jgi:ribonuclease D
MPFEMITSRERLGEVAAGWRGEPALALDTEFVFERTFHPRLGLVQVATPAGTWLVDPVALGDLAPLAGALAAAALRTLHAGQGDLQALARRGVWLTSPLFDTQIAAALAGLGGGLSYQRLVAALRGIELAKHATRSDWLARPLSERQRTYAAEDVAHLVPVGEELRSRLERLGRLAWAFEDSARLLADAAAPADLEDAVRRLGSLGHLSPRARAAARALAAWREREADLRDLPRRWVLSDEALLRIARLDPDQPEPLAALEGVPRQQVASDGEAWIEILRTAGEEPAPPASARLEPRERKSVDRLAALVRHRAAELEIPAELLAPRRLLIDLVRRRARGGDGHPDGLRGWREREIGRDLAASLG